jgi:hypothetical protein
VLCNPNVRFVTLVRRLSPALCLRHHNSGCMDSKTTSTLNPIRALRNKLDKRHGSSSNTTREQKLLERQPSGLGEHTIPYTLCAAPEEAIVHRIPQSTLSLCYFHSIISISFKLLVLSALWTTARLCTTLVAKSIASSGANAALAALH